MMRMIDGRRIYLVLLILYCSFGGNAQTSNLEILQQIPDGGVEWYLYDAFGHLILDGEEFASTDVVSLLIESNKRYIFETVVSETDTQDSGYLTLSLDGQPILLIQGGELETGIHSHPFVAGSKDRKLKILGGSDTDISLFPWQAFLISGNLLCGAVIIDDRWLLTAAHCTLNAFGLEISPDRMEVRVGASNPSNTGQANIYQVRNVIVHEHYNDTTQDNDIALLELQEELTVANAQPIALVTSDDSSMGATDPGVMGTITGWGLIQVEPQVLPEILQKVQLPIVSNSVAAQVWGPISPTFLMAGYRNGSKDACSGDSGGPLVVPVDGDFKLAGITSWGSEDCDTYGAYTRISTFESWIRDHTGIQEYDILESVEGEQLICRGIDTSMYRTNRVPGGTYEWQLAPPEAGQVEYENEQARVLWTEDYTGLAMISSRVRTEGESSIWKRLGLEVVPQTSLDWQSSDTTLCENEELKLELRASGHELEYTWYKDDSLWRQNSTGFIDFNEISRESTGVYYGIVSGSCGIVRSTDISLTVHPLTGILSQSPDIQADNGSTAFLEVMAEGHALSYRWEKDGVVLPNENLSQLSITDVNASHTGIYRLKLMGTCGDLMSDSIYLYVRSSSDMNEADIYIWPSVSDAIFNIASNQDEPYDLQIFNLNGQLVQQTNEHRYRDVIDLSGKSSGIYLVHVITGKWSKTLKILKE